MSTQVVREEVLLNIRCIVKGYHRYCFMVNVVEVFTASKKRGERGNAFKVFNHRGHLSHLQFPFLVTLFMGYVWTGVKNGKETFEFSKENGYMWTGRSRKRKKRVLLSC